MAFSRVQAGSANLGGGASNTLTVNISASTAGNLIVVFGDSFFNTALTVSDSQSNTYTLIAGDGDAANSRGWGGMFYLKNCPAGITSVTASGYGFGSGGLLVVEYSGADTTAPLDVSSAKNNGFGTAAFTSNTTATTSTANSLVVAAVGSYVSSDGAYSGYSGAFTAFNSNLSANGDYLMAEQLSAGVGTYVFSGTNSGSSVNNTAVIAVFKPAGGGGGGTTPHYLTLMGMGN